jgi:hypothetical protein
VLLQAARTLVSTPASNNIVERRALFIFGFMLLKAQVLCGRAFPV